MYNTCKHRNIAISFDRDDDPFFIQCVKCGIIVDSNEARKMDFDSVEIKETVYFKEDKNIQSEIDRLLNFLIRTYKNQGGDISPEWEPLDTFVGRMTQIDNLLCGFNLILKASQKEIK